MLIPSLYATNLRTPSLRPVRVPSDQNTRWRLPFYILLIRDKNSLSLHICQINLHSTLRRWTIVATPHTCDKENHILIVILLCNSFLEGLPMNSSLRCELVHLFAFVCLSQDLFSLLHLLPSSFLGRSL